MPKINTNPINPRSRTTTLNLTIFHTNDMNGRFEAMARLSSYAKRMRHEAETQGRKVFLWDAGDAVDESTRLCSMSKGAALSPILNVMGYDLQAMGDTIALVYGPQAMADVAANADFPILAANYRNGTGPLPEGLHEYALVPLPGGLQMGVIGLTSPWGGLYDKFRFRFPDYREVTRRLVNELRAKGASPVIVLSHLGLKDDRRLVEAVKGIDVIIGGHSHDILFSGEIYKGVLIAHAGQNAETLGKVDLTISAISGLVLLRKAQVLEVPADELLDPTVTAVVRASEQLIDTLMARNVGGVVAPLDLDHFRECGVGNLAADALRERLGAEVAMVSSGHLHQGLMLAGTVTLGQLETVCSTTANPCLSILQGRQIVQALERGLDPAVVNGHHYYLNGTPMGIPQISGMEVEFDPDMAVGQRVKRVLINGEPLEYHREYRVAHTNAEIVPDVGYLKLEDDQRTVQEVPTILREVLEDYVQRHSPVPKPSNGRWRQVTKLAA
jgi:5'-nucleotidase